MKNKLSKSLTSQILQKEVRKPAQDKMKIVSEKESFWRASTSLKFWFSVT